MPCAKSVGSLPEVTGSLVTSNSHHRPVPEAGCPVGPREPHRSLRNFDEFRLRIWFDNIDDEFREIPIINFDQNCREKERIWWTCCRNSPNLVLNLQHFGQTFAEVWVVNEFTCPNFYFQSVVCFSSLSLFSHSFFRTGSLFQRVFSI